MSPMPTRNKVTMLSFHLSTINQFTFRNHMFIGNIGVYNLKEIGIVARVASYVVGGEMTAMSLCSFRTPRKCWYKLSHFIILHRPYYTLKSHEGLTSKSIHQDLLPSDSSFFSRSINLSLKKGLSPRLPSSPVSTRHEGGKMKLTFPRW